MYHKMEIQLDEEKLKASGKNAAEYEAYLDGFCAEMGLVRDSDFKDSLLYYCPEQRKGFDSVGAAYLELEEDEFFIAHCKKWLVLEYERLDQDYNAGFATNALSYA